MTSKISFTKLVREDIRRRGWLMALYFILFFLFITISSVLFFQNYTDISALQYENLQNSLPGLLNGAYSRFPEAVIAAAAVLTALTGFGFIHSRERLDFYHSFPVRRECWFLVSYLAGAVIFLIPYIVSVVLSLAVFWTHRAADLSLTLKCLAAAGGGILSFFLLYSVCILAIVLTGRAVTALPAMLIISVYPLLVLTIYTSLQETFFLTYYSDFTAQYSHLLNCSSPASLFHAVINVTGRTISGSGSFLPEAAVMTAAAAAASFILYRIYPSEAAGNALAFPKTAPIIKILVTIPSSFFLSIFVLSMSGVSGRYPMIALSLFFAVVLCAVIEFFYSQDLKTLLKNWRSSLIAVSGTILILCVMQFDLFGYDTYLPDENQIESLGFRPNSFSSYFEYPSDYFTYSDTDNIVFTEQFGPLLQLAEEAVPAQKQYSRSGDQEDLVSSLFCYRLKNGKTVYRRYLTEYDRTLSTLEELGTDDSYRQDLFPVFHYDIGSIRSVSLSDIYGIPEELPLTEEEKEELIEAYRLDTMDADIRTIASEQPVGMFSCSVDSEAYEDLKTEYEFPDNYTLTFGSLYIYPEYSRTMEWLSAYGLTVRTQIDPEDILTISLYLSSETLSSGRLDDVTALVDPALLCTDSEILLSSREAFEAVLPHLELNTAMLLGSQEESEFYDYADIQYKNGSGLYGYRIR